MLPTVRTRQCRVLYHVDESVDLSDLIGLRDRTPRSVSLIIDVDPLNFG